MAASDKTEKATPKRKEDARNKGQVARSADLNGAGVLLAGLLALGVAGESIGRGMATLMVDMLHATADPRQLESADGLGPIFEQAGMAIVAAIWPITLACGFAAVAANVAQVRFKLTPKALKPDPKRLNPLKGAKNIFGPKLLVEFAKAVLKVGSVGAIVGFAVIPQLDELAALTGMGPGALATQIASNVKAIFLRGGTAYLAIALADLVYQRYQHEKSMRMDKQEIKQEHKQQNTPAEVKAAQRRRAMQAARTRMMTDVPQADVVVTNPTHYAVALKYDPDKPAPEVIAKGVDLVAKRIREIAAEHGVPVVPDPPLARALHAGVEVGQTIPEELFQAVARVLAYVYRVAGRRAA
jgi:flagellar biosynthesis protein FlhB